MTPMPTPIPHQLTFEGMPLAVYRELAAHLCQIVGVTVTLLPQDAPTFDYTQSQIGGLCLETAGELSAVEATRLQQILDYYSDRYPLLV